ncbi:hypothetical protein F3Y22_tig00111022pilonHSYRG00341 [Hibiscus syriacus]|uniref:EF-hand domain-containing protein n=1 Tax=Hibiscus syriacus TaxID=106335 RepID=A0A6A2Z743_HIBSY|nr:hypothetical protein F3Y22_tig00111022pilonHSYRG00341 [Hibiscus syriacus]
MNNWVTSFRRLVSTARKRRNGAPNIPRVQRTASTAARGLRSLRFLDKTVTGKKGDTWKSTERRFNQFSVKGMLYRDKFGACVGNIRSFVYRDRAIMILNGMNGDSKEFAEGAFDALAREHLMPWQGVKIFFDMCDKNGDGKLSEEEVKELWQLEILLRGIMASDDSNKSITVEFLHDNWRRIWITGYCVCVAKGSAEALKLNMALVLLPVCRGILTKLGSLFLNQIIPFDDNINFRNFPSIYIKGPYGAPTQNYNKFDILLLIGLGIGATPFIRIIKDLLSNIKPSSKKYPDRAYFYWVTREQDSFEWFKGVMDDIAKYDQNKIIEMHNYLTSVYREGDARSALIGMMQKMQQAKNGVDIVWESRVIFNLVTMLGFVQMSFFLIIICMNLLNQITTHFARPNW